MKDHSSKRYTALVVRLASFPPASFQDPAIIPADEEMVASMSRLENDTIINVAQLLKEQVGAFRSYDLSLDWFALDSDIMASNIRGRLRLTRIATGILASGEVDGIGLIECVRCLEIYEQPFHAAFDQEFRPLVDVRTGALLERPDPIEDMGEINEVHELDISEPLRQEALLELPMRPICGENCPGPDVPEDADADKADERLRVLADLLEEEQASRE